MCCDLLSLQCRVCHVQASKLDRYMQRNSKGKLQGSAIHEYRAKFKPTSDSYDYDNKEFHWRRLLLKAEPQSGKTGNAQLHILASGVLVPHLQMTWPHSLSCSSASYILFNQDPVLLSSSLCY